jgi:hypothetical protein
MLVFTLTPFIEGHRVLIALVDPPEQVICPDTKEVHLLLHQWFSRWPVRARCRIR